jgi:hypothetical protein
VNRGFGFGGLGFGGFGWGYPLGWGWGYGGFGYPYYGGLGYGLGGYGWGYPYGYGYGFDPYYGYGYGYGYPAYGYGIASVSPEAGLGAGTAGAGFGYSPAYVAPGATPAVTMVPGRRILGIDEEPVVLPDGRKGMKITNIYPGTGAAKAGLQVGDVLISVNGYLTEQRGNLAWILAKATPGNELKMVVRTVKDGKDHTVTATIA